MSFDRPEGGERAVLVHINFPAGSMQEDLTEFEELARSAGASSVAIMTGTRKVPDPSYFIGRGKLDQVRTLVLSHQADIVLFNHPLTPAQERNLEKVLKCRVVDRIGLILDIFAQRARSFEGKLQVELAWLNHMATRLVRGWTHLERQRGGIGLRGGPGETQLETDRRLIRNRIKLISKRLEKVRTQREQGRRSRQRAIIPTIAIVGYTNAGKSTLFNCLTGAEVYVANRLFATLDPTLRRIQLPEIGAVILADTVGFIRHLPHDLVEAFQATLEEVSGADLLLHVVDINDNQRQATIEEVNTVLANIGADHIPQILIYNKIDLCEDKESGIHRAANAEVRQVSISAEKGIAISELHKAITEILGHEIIQREVILTPADARLRAELYELKCILNEKIDAQGQYHLLIRLPKSVLEKLFR